MSIFRKFLIFIIIIICLYIVYQLLQHRISLYEMKNNMAMNKTKTNTIEGYTNKTVTTIQQKNSQPTKITNYLFKNLKSSFGITKPTQKQLKQFCIKASCNTAYDGVQVSLDMIQYVLSRGCRFLDFEVYWDKPTLPDGTEDKGQTTSVPVVSVSDDPTTPATNCVALDEVFKFLQQNAFNQSVCPNSSDPLFIQIRVKYNVPLNKTNNQQILYNSIGDIIYNRLSQFQYHSTVNAETDITKLAGKVIIIMDTYANRSYVEKSTKLYNMVNMESNSDVLTHTTYEDVIKETANGFPIDKNGVVTKMKTIQQVLPMSTINDNQYLFTDNYDSMSVISRYSVQFTPMIFWRNDSYLQKYEKMFNDTHTAIIMLSSAMSYAEGQKVIPSIVYP